jgi:ATP-dependent Lhr-like helicase
MDVQSLLDPRVVEVAKEAGLEELTEPQIQAIPPILKGENVLLVAPTGVGKTEAAILPLFHQLLRDKGPGFSVLYITPLRALNRDMLRRLTLFGERLDVEVGVRHGDTSRAERTRQSRRPPPFLITTPETLQIMFMGSRLREHLRSVRWVVVDEIHELAGGERGDQLAVGLERLARLCGRDFQRIGLSATVGDREEVARFLAGVGRTARIVHVPVPKGMRIRVVWPERESQDKDLARELRMNEEHAAALRVSRDRIEDHRSTLFFVNTRDTAEFLASRLGRWAPELGVGVHHGSLSRELRVSMEDDFKAEAIKGLICTSSLELGIDVGSADFVLQYNSPRQVTRLIQRIGRSGHGVGEVSEGLVVATHADDFGEACVIARRALAEEPEPLQVRENNLSVLSNQLIAFTLSDASWDADEAYGIIRRAYPFRNLPRDTFDAVLRQLGDLRGLWVREGGFDRSRGSRPYFLENISMIPDTRTYRVVDLSTRKVIGTLDEWFVAEYAKLGATFTMRGIAWRFVEFNEGEVLAEPIAEIGDVPMWIGEDLPVPFEVAMEVGRLRREKDFSRYPGDPRGQKAFGEYLAEQGEDPVATDRVVTLEMGREAIVVNCTFGTRVNETLAQLITALLSARFGESVGVTTDPYRIILTVPGRLKPERLIEVLTPENPEMLEPLLRAALKNSTFFRWQFVHVAKKFGAIKRDVDWQSVNLRKLVALYEDTPLFQEAIEKILWERLDLKTTREVLRRMRDGEIAIQVVPRLTRVGLAGMEKGRGIMAPQRADKGTLMALKARLERTTVHLLCLNCRSRRRSRVEELPERLQCLVCDGVMTAVLGRYQLPLADLLGREDLTPDERRAVRALYTNASLVKSHGRRAAMALVARGVGPDTAVRILRVPHEDELEFLRAILTAEVTYARTKRFWD